MKKRFVDIIIPTLDNFQYLKPCLTSIVYNKMSENMFNVIVVNNGHKNSCDWIKQDQYLKKDVTVLQPGMNMGWEGGINHGLEYSTADFVVFMNDDTHVPKSSRLWLNYLLSNFANPKLGAVGAISNVVMGDQNIFTQGVPIYSYVKYLIGFCMMVRREAIDKVGGLDETLPGGDDLDFSIRLRDEGYMLKVDKKVFIYHHGFKTGERLKGAYHQDNGWNSFKMYQNTNTSLIRKHGFRKWFDTQFNQLIPIDYEAKAEDTEGEWIKYKLGDGDYLDLGCGFRKTREDVTGVDLIPKGELIDSLGHKSKADVVADITRPMPFKDGSYDGIIARHILEHMIDPVKFLKECKRILKKNGDIFIAVPDENKITSIPMNVEHVHAFTMESLAEIVRLIGFQVMDLCDPGNDISFIIHARKLK
jgi:GT2 family glycosyltransferase